MITLPTEFKKGPFYFKLIKREGRIALLEKSKGEGCPKHYEVIVIQKRKDAIMFGNTIPAHEAVPGDEMWGAAGFSPYDLAAAELKFAALTKKQNEHDKQ